MRSAYGHFMMTFDLCRDSGDGSELTTGSVEEACARAFAVLREAEAFALANGAEFICIADFEPGRLSSGVGLAEALHDRMFRAASGRRAVLALSSSTGAGPCVVQLSGGAP